MTRILSCAIIQTILKENPLIESLTKGGEMRASKKILGQDKEIVEIYPKKVRGKEIRAVRIRIELTTFMPGGRQFISKDLAKFIDNNKYVSRYLGDEHSSIGTHPTTVTTVQDFYVPEEVAPIIKKKLKEKENFTGDFTVYPLASYYVVLKKQKT